MNSLVLQAQEVDFLLNLASRFEIILSKFSNKELLTRLMVVNTYLFKQNRLCGVVSDKDENNRRHYDYDKAGKALEQDTLVFSITGLSTLGKKHWYGLVYYSREKLTQIRKSLATDCGLFTLEDRGDWQTDPKKRTRAPNPCSNIQYLRMVIVAFVLEKILKARNVQVFPTGAEGEICFPSHKAYTSKVAVDAFLKGLIAHGRDGEINENGEIVYPVVGEPHPEALAAIAKEKENPLENHVPFVKPEPPAPPADPEIPKEEWVERYQEVEEVEEEAPAVPVNNIKPRPKLKNSSVLIPNFAWVNSQTAIDWWENIKQSASWIIKFAPDFVLDRLVPY